MIDSESDCSQSGEPYDQFEGCGLPFSHQFTEDIYINFCAI